MCNNMKKVYLILTALLCCTALVLGGCKYDADKAQETASETVPATTEADYGYDKTSPKSAEWFNNAVFIGDSVTLKLSYYCESHPEALGDAQFFCAGSLGYTSALWDIDDSRAVHPYYKGEMHLTEDCVAVTGKNNVFIMLGMNDIGLYGTQGAMDSCKTLVSHILEKSPDAHIYIQSVTPMIKSAQKESFNNTLVKEFNGLLKSYCEENHYKYLDVFSALADKDGNLPDDLCGDTDNMGLHFNDKSCLIWVDYLKNNA